MVEATEFRCPHCEAEYKVVRVEAPAMHDRQLLCLSCASPLQNREGNFALKYFRIDAPRRNIRIDRGAKF